MACCKCCCGGVDCAEGDQGKCCCGGSSGTCCTASQYCCSGVCQATPCVDCQNFDFTPCNYSCGAFGCFDDQQCEEGTLFGDPPDTNGDCLAYYTACCPVCIGFEDEFGVPGTYCGDLP
jgi:hypothetical protein